MKGWSLATVLLVEDDPKSARAVAGILAEEGLGVTTVSTGAEAFACARQSGFDAIVLDRMLPGGIDGLGVLECCVAPISAPRS